MKNINLMQKLSSRKLWLSIAGIATGIALVFGVDESEISTLAGAIVSIASIITYVVTEGKIDAANAANNIAGVLLEEIPLDTDSDDNESVETEE